jgi:hypothetical protein
MRPVKNSLDSVQQKPDTGAVPFESFSTKRHKHRLDVIPDYAGLHRVMKYFFQRLTVLAGHTDLVSFFDIFVNWFHCLSIRFPPVFGKMLAGRPYMRVYRWDKTAAGEGQKDAGHIGVGGE